LGGDSVSQRRDRGGASRGEHWFLDALVHRPDLPLLPGVNTKVGLGLWDSVPATLIVEGAIFLAGVLVYVSVTSARNRVGKFGFRSFVAVLGAIYTANVFGPPPPSIPAIIVAGLAGAVVLIAWAAWFDSQRRVLG
jgi:hypothetical protein